VSEAHARRVPRGGSYHEGETGSASLELVANGIASPPVLVNVE
jgi:hypothetical protein